MRYVLLCGMLMYAFAARAQWSGATIDTLTRNTNADENTKQSLAVDDAGTLHAVWQSSADGISWNILYSKRPFAGTWTLPSEIMPAGAGTSPAVAVHRATGKPGVALIGATALSNEVLVAGDSAGMWQFQRVTTDTLEDSSPAVAVDRNGRIHLAWISETEPGVYKIKYGHNIGGTWQVQVLDSSELGPFGSGAAPFISVTDSGRAHITYRAGDFGTYHIDHAWNTSAGSTSWLYETVTTPNGNDFTSITAITPDNTLHVLASGNDGFGFPPQAYYTRKTGTSWTSPVLTNDGRNGWGGSLCIDVHGNAHITIDETSGNFYTGNHYYATNRAGNWASNPLLADGATYNGVMIVGMNGRGHALAYNGNTSATEEIFAINTVGTVTSVNNDAPTVPAVLRLEQNFPNPFNPRTTIKFWVSEPGLVTLKLFDVLGREVATLLNEEKAPGSYQLVWDANDFSSGAYFYTLTAGGLSQTKQLILLK